MKKQLRNLFLYGVLFAAILAVFGCAPQLQGVNTGDTHSIAIMTWNVHNLFDGKDDGSEYAEYLFSAGWSQEKYNSRIITISEVICGINPLPDLIVFQEIENLQILEDIALSLPSGYNYSHFANNPGGIGLGILSRFPLLEPRAHSITVGGITTPRPVLEVKVETPYAQFVLMACHWKSKVGGVEVTEFNRRASARAIIRRLNELWETEPDLGVIIAGDLNENFDEFSRRGSNVICALLPDDFTAARLTGKDQIDFIVISGNKPPMPVFFPDDIITFYSPWINELENGSYIFRNSWETIDHFLVSRHFFEDFFWVYESSIVLDYEPFIGREGLPVPYNPRTGFGLSDHLPLLMKLTVKR